MDLDDQAHVKPKGEDHELSRDCPCRPGTALERRQTVIFHFPNRVA